MGSYDCYCALCGGPLGNFIRFGSKVPKHLRKRRRRIERKKRRLAGEDNVHEDHDSEKVDDEGDIEMVDNPEELLANAVEQEKESNGGDNQILEYAHRDRIDHFSENEAEEDIDGEDEDDTSEGENQDEDANSHAASEDSRTHDSYDYNTNPYAFHGKSETDEMFKYYEKTTYDPTVLKPEDVKWLHRCRCLGFNADAEGVTKAFVSGRGTYNDYGDFRVRTIGNDPNDTHQRSINCFYSYDENEISGFPFHETCYRILARALFGKPDIRMIDKDVLYSVFAEHTSKYGRCLDVDYGGIEGMDQSWECFQGEEYSSCYPGMKPEIKEILHGMLPAQLFASPLEQSDLSHKVQNDVFTNLPYDILHLIFPHLSTSDMLSLIRASYSVCSATRSTSFWKSQIRTRILPWFWEIEDLFDSTFPTDFNFKRTFLWLEKLTGAEFGMIGPFLGLANRRRIWNVCQELVPSYIEKVPKNAQPGPDAEAAKAIIDKAFCLHMPLVTYPKPKKTNVASAQFIRSWNEIESKSSVLETFWNDNGALVGISVTFDSVRRVFGMDEESKAKAGIGALYIPAGEWIKEIVVYMRNVDMFDRSGDRSKYRTAMDIKPKEDVWIEALSVKLTSGLMKEIVSPSINLNRRPFSVLPGHHLIGLTGQIASNGVISRLGLLQATRPGSESSTRPSYPVVQTLLWNENAAKVPFKPSEADTIPIWSHPTARILPSIRPETMFDVPIDMLPHQVLMWAQYPDDLQYLKRISCFTVVAGMASGGSKADGTHYERPILDIVGLRAEYVKYRYEDPREIGTGGPVPRQLDIFKTMTSSSPDIDLSAIKPWAEENMVHFDIDGQGGERITEVHIAEEAKAIKLRTNRGREAYFGEENRSRWTVQKAEEGQFLAGLVVCFGALGGFSWGLTAYSHWKSLIAGVVVMPLREGD